MLYFTGDGVKQNHLKATEWLQKALKQHEPKANQGDASAKQALLNAKKVLSKIREAHRQQASPGTSLEPGTDVIVFGLVKKPEYNEQPGSILGFVEKRDRFKVRLKNRSAANGEQEVVAIRRGNLKLAKMTGMK